MDLLVNMRRGAANRRIKADGIAWSSEVTACRRMAQGSKVVPHAKLVHIAPLSVVFLGCLRYRMVDNDMYGIYI